MFDEEIESMNPKLQNTKYEPSSDEDDVAFADDVITDKQLDSLMIVATPVSIYIYFSNLIFYHHLLSVKFDDIDI